MATCVGCGLTTDPVTGVLMVHLDPDGCILCDDTDGLRVNVCPGGGIICSPTDGSDPDCPTGGLKIDPSALPINAGCGIDYSGGVLSVDICDGPASGLACGDAEGDTTCLFAFVQNQGAAACIPLGTAEDRNNCQPNGCNGMVRTCDGLWAPSKLSYCSGIVSETTGSASMAPLLFPKTSMDADFPPSHQGPNEWIIGGSANSVIFEWCCCNDSCNIIHGNTFTNGYTPIVIVAPGQVHRFTVWERLGYLEPGNECGDVVFSPAPPGSNMQQGWVLQNQILFDEFGAGKSSGYAAAFIDSSWIIDDPGLCVAGQMCITYQRFGPGPVGPGGRPNDALSGNFGIKREYLHTLTGAHCHNNETQEMRAVQP